MFEKTYPIFIFTMFGKKHSQEKMCHRWTGPSINEMMQELLKCFSSYHIKLWPKIYIAGCPINIQTIFKSGCGLPMSQAKPTIFLWFLSILMAKISENLMVIASIIPLSMAS